MGICMGVMITYHRYNNPVYDVHKNVGAHIHGSTLYTAKYGIYHHNIL